jgi:hypothetical protein
MLRDRVMDKQFLATILTLFFNFSSDVHEFSIQDLTEFHSLLLVSFYNKMRTPEKKLWLVNHLEDNNGCIFQSIGISFLLFIPYTKLQVK